MSGCPGAPHGPVADPLAVLRAAQEARVAGDGVPMVLALIDERGEAPSPAATGGSAEGAALAELAGTYADALAPSRRADDEGPLVMAVVVLAYAHLFPDQVPQQPPEPVAEAS